MVHNNNKNLISLKSKWMVGRSETDKIVATQRSKLQLLCDCMSSFGHKACGGHLAFFAYGNRSKLQESRFYEDLVNGQNSRKAYVVSQVKRDVATKPAMLVLR